MLSCVIPFRSTAFPLSAAQRYQFSTGLTGDNTGTITVDRALAAYLRATDIGDELVLYSSALGIVWRGQIEGIIEHTDGTTTMMLVGIGRLVHDVPVSVVGADVRQQRWELPTVSWITGTPWGPRPDMWDVHYMHDPAGTTLTVTMQTKSGVTYTTPIQCWLVYRFPAARWHMLHGVAAMSITGGGGIVANIQIGALGNAEPPYTPLTSVIIPTNTTLQIIDFPDHANATGWYIHTQATGVGGAGSYVSIMIQMSAIWSGTVLAPRLQSVITDRLNVPIAVSTNNLVVYSLFPDYAGRLGDWIASLRTLAGAPVAQYIHRDTATLMLTTAYRQRLYRVSPRISVERDWSTVPSHVWGAWQDDGGVLRVSPVASSPLVRTKKTYDRHAVAIASDQASAIAERNRLLRDAQQPRPRARITVNDVYPVLATCGGVVVPPYTAEPGDLMLLGNEWTEGLIVSRDISDTGVTYEITVPDERLATLAQR